MTRRHRPLIAGLLATAAAATACAAPAHAGEASEPEIKNESGLTEAAYLQGEAASENAPLFFLDGRTLNPLQVPTGS